MSKIQTVIAKLEKLANNLPRIAGNIVVNETKENFRRQAFFNGPKWDRRKDNLDPTRGILIGKRSKSAGVPLRKSIQILAIDANSVTVGSRLPYAKRHNEGLDGMPKRQFMSTRRIKGSGSLSGYEKAFRKEYQAILRNAFR
jgi:phage gpG-like protein